MRTAALATLLALACLLLIGPPASADDPPEQTGKQDTPISPLLQQFIQERESGTAQSSQDDVREAFSKSQSDGGLTTKDAQSPQSPTTTSETSDDPVRFDSAGNVQVYIYLNNTDDDTLQHLRDLGADIEVVNSDWNVVQAWLPITALEAISDLDAVKEITPPDYAETEAGRVTTEGDGIHRTNLVRIFSGFSGRGVKVGAISDGVNARRTPQASNDLPDSIEVDPNSRGSGDEGTALLEVVHDMAPNAELAFSGPETSLEMADSILWLANKAFDGEGADIIVDDLAYYTEPFFGDGIISEAAADAVAGGAVFVSSAGNNSYRHYDGEFVDGGEGFHDFDDDASKTDISLRIEAGTNVYLQWNDEFGSSGNDYDLFLCPPGLKPVKFNLQNDICDGSVRKQDGDDNPYEVISTHSINDSNVDLYIRKFSGDDRRLKLIVARGAVLEHGVTTGGLVGHDNLEEVLAVGAIDASDPGNDEPQVYSDHGPAEIYFPTRETRNKPDVMGIDGVRITGAGRFGIPIEGSTFRRFYGTSAAAPHVAGIAALVMEAQRKATPDSTKKTVADSVFQTIRNTAIDLGEAGRDDTFGYGRADALSALGSIASSSDAVDLYYMTSYADTHTVNSTGDGSDSDTTDGVCDDGTVDGSTNCTLRAAIQQTNAGVGATIKFNISGNGVQTISPTSALPTITKPVFIDGYSQTGASAGTVLIELDGTNAGPGTTDGLSLSGGRGYIRGLAVNNFAWRGIVLQNSSRYILEGNMVGTDTTGSTDEGNGHWGVYLTGVTYALIEDNVISGNDSYGLNTSIGGELHFYGNKIGTNADGTVDLGNTLAGVRIASSPVVLRDNVISGNDTHGIHLDSNVTRDVIIQNNRIGTNDAGTAALGNTRSGIFIDGDPKENVVSGNIIGGNGTHGVWVYHAYARDNLIAENYIGTNASGTDLGNGGSGVNFSEGRLGGPDNNTVERNVIAYNDGDGVTITGSSTGNSVWENSIHSNDGHGIDLGDDGVTANDSNDADSGPNHLQNYPTNITYATRGDEASVRFSIYGIADRRYVVDFYSCDSAASGEGQQWLGFTSATPSVTGERTFTATTLRGQITDFTATTATHITATATDRETDSTSEFAPCVARVNLPELVISESAIQVTEGSTTDYTIALSALPSADVTVTLSSFDTSEATVSDTTFTFTTTDGTTAQTVTVTGVADNDAENEVTSIRHEVSIGSNNYTTAVIPVEVTDDDAPTLTLVSTTTGITFPSDVSVGHSVDGRIGNATNPFNEGTTATYSVQLDSEPDGDTTINLSSSDTGALTTSPTSITFTRTGEASDANKYEWDDPQTVTLTAVSDSDGDHETESVSHRTTIIGKSYVLGSVSASIRDLALPTLTYQQNNADIEEITVAEGGTTTYTLQMDSEPASDVLVYVQSSVGAAVIASPLSIVFTKTGEAQDADKFEWNDPQTVTVRGVADGDQVDDVAIIRHWHNVYGRVFYRWPSLDVTVIDGNRAPYFEDGLSTTRQVPENAGQDDNVGDPIAAIDLNNDTLTYSLDDASGKFSINTGTGQITVVADDSLDHETTEDYEMDVTVTDRATNGLTDKIEVKILVTNVNEPPSISGNASLTFPENTAITRVLHRYTFTDPESGTVSWSVDGTDSAAFAIDANGNLKFSTPPDFEAQEELNVTVVATDDGVPAEKDEFPVVVTLTNVDDPPAIAGDDVLTFAENTDTTTVLETYTASDPEGVTTTFTWSLAGTDIGDFEISATGELTFKNVPDFDIPADSGGNNEYIVQIRANDGSLTGTLDVSVNITNVNEAPSTPTGMATITVAENTTGNLARYSSTDPDKDDTLMWDVSGTDADDFRIDSSGNLAFDGAPDHEMPGDSGGNNVYEISIDAGDGSLTSSLAVTVTVTPVDEPPVITGTTTIDDYDENGTDDVATYTATDPEGDTNITWSLGGSDSGDFDITSGVLFFKNTPDYERPSDSGGNNHYEVTVQAADSNKKRGELHIDIIVTPVDEPPVIAGPDRVDFPENSPISRQVSRYTATDPEGAMVSLTISGTNISDGASLTLASDGVLNLNESPDYEEKKVYTLFIRARDGSHAVDQLVVVNIQNIEEPGSITLSSVQPQEETVITATLTDDDGPENITWQWYRTSSQSGAGSAITSATSASYTPVAYDVGSYLRAVASYDDAFGSKMATAVSANRALAVNPDNVRPVFPTSGDYGRTIRENLPAGRSLGAPVTATDGNDDRLTYSVGVNDNFDIVEATGQLRTKTVLDHEDQEQHFVTVTATDPGNLAVSVTVTITVEDVDEFPAVTGPTTVDFREGETGTIATYTSTDPDDDGIAWVLTGTDADDLTLNNGDLTFNEIPDYEEKNQYRVTIEAREQGDGTSAGRLNVTIRVTNVDEPGMIETNVEEPRVRQTLHLNVVDEDGGERVTEWKWERGEPNSPCGTVDNPTVTTWQTITNARSSGYTPTVEDQGHCIRVTAFYNDKAGSGRTEQFLTPNSVEIGPFFTQGPPTFNVQENSAENKNVGRLQAQHSNSGEALTYSLTGTDASYFTIDNNAQLKTSAIVLDYENQPGPTAEFEVVATDNNGESATIAANVNVTDECISSGEPPCAPSRPSVSSASDTSLQVTWSQPRTPTGTDITGYDLQNRALDSGDSWTPQTVSGTDRSHTIENLTKGTTYEVQVSASSANGQGAWSVSGTGTPGGVSPPPPPPPRSGGGGGGGGGSSNRPPSVDGPRNLQYPEHGTEPVATYTAEDPEGTDIGWSIEDTDAEHFRISEEGVLTFIKPPDYEDPIDFRLNNTYEVRILAFDSGIPRASGRLQVRIEIKQVNEIGPITGEAQLSVEEGETGTLAQYTAEDPEEDAIGWSLSGPDAELFQIDDSGTLSLNEALDFEAPASASGTNDYAVTVVATDDNRRPVSLEVPVTVAVANVNEGPVGVPFSPLELTTRDSPAMLDLTEFFTDPDGDSLTYTITDDAESDVASATLEEATLIIETLAAGTASFLIIATDDGKPPLSQQLQLAVTVTIANEQPVSIPIPDVELIADSPTTALDLSEFFTDPDGNSLIYGIDTGEAPDVASATVEGSILSITPLKEGAVMFKVTATDEAGLAETIALEVLVAAPPPPPQPTPTPVPALTSAPAPTPTPEPTPKATSTPIPAATPTPSPAPTLAPTASPTPTSTSTPTAEPTPVDVSQSTPTPENIRAVAPETAQTPEEMPTSFPAWIVALTAAGFLLALAGAAIYAIRLRR